MVMVMVGRSLGIVVVAAASNLTHLGIVVVAAASNLNPNCKLPSTLLYLTPTPNLPGPPLEHGVQQAVRAGMRLGLGLGLHLWL